MSNIPLWPSVDFKYKYTDVDILSESAYPEKQLDILLETKVRKYSEEGDFYFTFDVTERAHFRGKRLEDVIGGVFNQFTKGVYKAQLYYKYQATLDIYGEPICEIDKINMPEEGRLKFQ